MKNSGAYYRSIKKKTEQIMRRAEEIRDEIKRNRAGVGRRVAPMNICQIPRQISIRNDLVFLQPPPINLSSATISAGVYGVHICRVWFQSESIVFSNVKYFSLIDVGGSVSSTQNMFCDRENHDDISFIADDGPFDDDDEDESIKNLNFRSDLKKWALAHNITHMALKDLMMIVRKRFVGTDASSTILPEDPRTLLQTPPIITIVSLPDGEYWHYGLKKCLEKIFCKVNKPIMISVMINIDGLPLFKSSKTEFWPILFNIAEMPKVPAMVIGIFCGKAKTTDIDAFLTPFVDELCEMMANGLIINSHKMTVRLRCILCDSPARAYIKGI